MRCAIALLCCLLALPVAVPTPALGEVPAAVRVPPVRDLQRLAREAQRQQIPIMLEFAASYCSYCRLLEEQILQPMLLAGAERGRVLMRMVEIDSYARVRDFDGRNVTPEALARRYAVFVTPTLVLVDARGNELGERIVGVSSLDFFGAYLDVAIDAARQAVRAEIAQTRR